MMDSDRSDHRTDRHSATHSHSVTHSFSATHSFRATHSGWVAWFTRNPVAANLLMLLILVAGVLTALNLRVEAFPPLPPDSVSVSVLYDSGSAKSAEEGVAIKIEEALQGIQGIGKITSHSDSSGAHLSIERSSGYDLDVLYRDIKNRVDSIATLPQEAERPVITRATYLEDALTVHLYGDTDADVLQELARRLRMQLLNNPAIERINYYGQRTPEIVIQMDEARLQSWGLTLQDVAERIRQSSLTSAGGELFSAYGNLVVKADQQRYQQREFGNILIRETPSGQRLLLSDVALIQDGFAQTPVLSRFNGQTAIGLDVKMYNTSDIIAISEQVAIEVEQFRRQLPEGVSVDIWNDQSHYITSRLNLLLENSLIGIGLVMLLLALFLNVRVAFWVGAGLPVIFAGAMLLMGPGLFDYTLNELTTFGFIMALGIVVDDAVVVGESIYASREKEGATIEATIRGAQRVSVPTVFGVLTTVVAFMALALVEGEMGKIFSFFAFAAAFCLIVSLVESKLILPAHLAHVRMHSEVTRNPLKKGWQGLQQGVARGLSGFTRAVYRPLINKILAVRYATLMLACALFILVVGLVPSGQIRAVFFPDIPSDFIMVELALEDDAGYGLVHQQAMRIEQAAMTVSESLSDPSLSAMVPVPHLMTVADQKSALIIAGLSPRTERAVGTQEIADLWSAQLGAMEGVRKLKFITAWEGEDDISIELRSENSSVLNAASAEVREALGRFPGVSGIQNSLKAGQIQIDLKLLPQGEALGLTIQDIARQIQFAYQGYEIQRIQRGPDELKVKLRYPDQDRMSIDNLSQARIRTADGQVLPIRSVAEIVPGYAQTEIQRINRSRVAVISADTDKAIAAPAEVLKALQDELFVTLEQQYPGLSIHLAGEAQEEAQTRQSLQGAFIVALLAIYALLAIPLKSYVQPLMIMSAIPFGIVGALLGHWLHDIPLSVLSMFGILALSGVVVNDSLLLISHYNEFREEGQGPRQAMVNAGCHRMRAIVLTSITTFAGLVPLLAETSEQAQFLIPAALAMGYGILFATMITLILVPSLVLISEDVSGIFRGKPRRSEPKLKNREKREKREERETREEAEEIKPEMQIKAERDSV